MAAMELVVHIQDRESLAIALEQGVGAVAVPLPRDPDSQVWSELADWRAAARQHGPQVLSHLGLAGAGAGASRGGGYARRRGPA